MGHQYVSQDPWDQNSRPCCDVEVAPSYVRICSKYAGVHKCRYRAVVGFLDSKQKASANRVIMDVSIS